MSEGVAELDGERLTWMYRQMLPDEAKIVAAVRSVIP